MSETAIQAPAIDPTVPRRMYWQDQHGKPDACPKCGTDLVRDERHYALAVEEGGEVLSYVLSSDAGSFCPACPVVVLDADRFRELLKAENVTSQRFLVIGLANMDAIPEDKMDETLGSDENPVQVTEFLTNDTVKRTEAKIGRNDPCLCGSGKKYKKCCGR